MVLLNAVALCLRIMDMEKAVELCSAKYGQAGIDTSHSAKLTYYPHKRKACVEGNIGVYAYEIQVKLQSTLKRMPLYALSFQLLHEHDREKMLTRTWYLEQTCKRP